MFLTVFARGSWPQWVIVVALVALTPLPFELPSGIALAAIGLMGVMLLMRQPRQHARPAPVGVPRPARHVEAGTCHTE